MLKMIARQAEIEASLSLSPETPRHAFLGNNDGESKRNYLLLFALCIENSESLNGLARDFIALLAEESGLPELEKEIIDLADNPNRHDEYQRIFQALLDDEDKKYTWLLDVFYLLELAQLPIESAEMKAVLGILKPVGLKECLPDMRVIIRESDEAEVLNAGIKLATRTTGWKNIIRYREMRFDQHFAELGKRLDSVGWAIYELQSEQMDVYSKGMDYAFFCSTSDGDLLGNLCDKAAATLCSQGRKSALNSLNIIREKAEKFITENLSALYQANSLIARLNLPAFQFDVTDIGTDFDLNNSYDNEDWCDQFEYCCRKIEDGLKAFNKACEGAAEQISLFVAGNFDHSVIRQREQEELERLRKEALERLEKKFALVIKEGKECLLTIEWEKIEGLPFDPEKITHVKTGGNIWLAVISADSNDFFYRSEDGRHWHQVQVDAQDYKVRLDRIDFVNGMWILRNKELGHGSRDLGCYYSADAIAWRHSPAPAPSKRALSLFDGHISFEEIHYFDGLWLWRGQQYKSYSYTETGFFTDSTKTDDYSETVFYCAQDLDGPWHPWAQAPKLSEGVEIKAVRSLPGKNVLLIFCDYDRSYIRQKKKPDASHFVMYYSKTKGWKNCSWGSAMNFFFSGNAPIVFDNFDKLVCFSSGDILYSDKGYEWAKNKTRLHVDDAYLLKDFCLLTNNNKSTICLTEDAEKFKELMLEEGAWSHLTANEKGVFGVFSPNEHEEAVLQFGRYNYLQNAPSQA